MSTTEKISLTVRAGLNIPVDKVWHLWTDPGHIIHWNFASEDWHAPEAENDIRPGGRFRWRMEARDGSAGFDFSGTYQKVEINKLIESTLDDGRKVHISFKPSGNSTEITETFEAEKTNSPELQQTGWQAILNNFKKYAENVKG